MKNTVLLILLCLGIFSCDTPVAYHWNGKDVTMAILPMSDISAMHALQAKTILEATYHCKVTILSNIPLPDTSWYEPRQRYRADILIHWLSDTLNKYDRVIGITNKDIAIGEGSRNWGVFGYGSMPGRSCVISTFRLDFDKSGKVEKRFQKVVIHEVGHTFGLDHCSSGSTTCYMRDAEGKMQTVDDENFTLCKTCKAQLGALIR